MSVKRRLYARHFVFKHEIYGKRRKRSVRNDHLKFRASHVVKRQYSVSVHRSGNAAGSKRISGRIEHCVRNALFFCVRTAVSYFRGQIVGIAEIMRNISFSVFDGRRIRELDMLSRSRERECDLIRLYASRKRAYLISSIQRKHFVVCHDVRSVRLRLETESMSIIAAYIHIVFVESVRHTAVRRRMIDLSAVQNRSEFLFDSAASAVRDEGIASDSKLGFIDGDRNADRKLYDMFCKLYRIVAVRRIFRYDDLKRDGRRYCFSHRSKSENTTAESVRRNKLRRTVFLHGNNVRRSACLDIFVCLFIVALKLPLFLRLIVGASDIHYDGIHSAVAARKLLVRRFIGHFYAA